MVYLFLLELLIHRLGDPKCVVSEISGCSDMYVVIRYFTVSVRRTGTFLVYYKRGGPILCNRMISVAAPVCLILSWQFGGRVYLDGS